MILIKTAAALRQCLSERVSKGDSIGFVPTMGALHEGHLSLITAATRENPVVVCSIFVNPTQFNDPNDFKKYPITLEKDIALLEKAGTGILFLPSVGEMYPNGTAHLPHYPLGYLETILEGKYRPGHFQGVCQVMDRLLTIVHADHLYMGQKDYQQCMVVRMLIGYRQFAVAFHTCPTLRESDGLAMSSRNQRLSAAERQQAVAVSQALTAVRNNIQPGNVQPLLLQAASFLRDSGFAVDYVALCSASGLRPGYRLERQRAAGGTGGRLPE
ncbi:MAG: pantoate--beta-alanine ligase [Flavihumibacter sp.]